MKQYYDVYIRPAATPITGTTTSNALDGWDKLELLDAGAKLTVEPDKRVIGDGTEYTQSEKPVFEAATLRVDSDEFAYLRSLFHNQVCDVLLYDTATASIAIIAYRMRLQVSKVAESGGDILIKLYGDFQVSVAAMATRFVVVQWADIEDYGVLTGFVLDGDKLPIDGVLITATDSEETDWKDISDKDGNYMLLVPAGSYTIVVEKDGLTFMEATAVVLAGQTTNAEINEAEE